MVTYRAQVCTQALLRLEELVGKMNDLLENRVEANLRNVCRKQMDEVAS